VFAGEMRETLRQTILVLGFYILVPVLYIADLTGVRSQMSFLWYLSNGLNLNIVILVIYLAWNMFRSEERDGAREYLLSLPLSRWKILISKLVPRMLVLVPVLFLDQALAVLRYGTENVLSGRLMPMNVLLFMFIVTYVFCSGFVLGIIGRTSLLAVSILSVMAFAMFTGQLVIWIVFRLAALFKEAMPYGVFSFLLRHNASIDFLIYTGVLALIARPIYRKWDLGSKRSRELIFARRAVIPMLVLSVPVLRLLFSI
jgi:ABC-type transport system involved in multi-copper enzyme maturation permease subunit